MDISAAQAHEAVSLPFDEQRSAGLGIFHHRLNWRCNFNDYRFGLLIDNYRLAAEEPGVKQSSPGQSVVKQGAPSKRKAVAVMIGPNAKSTHDSAVWRIQANAGGSRS